MNTKTLHIKNPSKALLVFAKKLREEKQRNKEKLRSEKDLYFPQK